MSVLFAVNDRVGVQSEKSAKDPTRPDTRVRAWLGLAAAVS